MERLEALRQQTDRLSELSNQRLDCLEQAIPLVEHFVQLRTALVVTFDQLDKVLNDELLLGELSTQMDRSRVKNICVLRFEF